MARPVIPPVPKGRLLLLVGAAVALLAGLDAALLRLGLRAPVANMELANLHGLLMVFGFLGTAINLERAVAVQSSKTQQAKLAYASPIFSVAGTLVALILLVVTPDTASRTAPAVAWALSMVVLFAIYVVVYRRQPQIAVIIQSIGPVVGFVGVVMWGFGAEAAKVAPWWALFLVFTIIGERVELARVAFSGGSELRIMVEGFVALFALILTLWVPDLAYPLFGLALVIMFSDTLAHDVALKTINSRKLTKFMAAAMLTGYGWGIVAGVMWVLYGPLYAGYPYDTVIHALTIGFALSMVMAHAPVIIPAIARRTIPYSPAMWAVWGALQAGLLIRVVSGTHNFEGAWQFGGILDIVALLGFVVMTLTLIVMAQRKYAKARLATRRKVEAKREREIALAEEADQKKAWEDR